VRVFLGELFYLWKECSQCRDETFGDHGVPELVKSEVKLFFEHASFDPDRRLQIVVFLCWFICWQFLFDVI